MPTKMRSALTVRLRLGGNYDSCGGNVYARALDTEPSERTVARMTGRLSIVWTVGSRF